MKLNPGQLTLTHDQQLFCWRKALRAQSDFYVGGQRYHGYSVEIRGGDLWARPIGGQAKENIKLAAGFCPTTAGGTNIYAAVPERIALALYRNKKEQKNELRTKIQRP